MDQVWIFDGSAWHSETANNGLIIPGRRGHVAQAAFIGGKQRIVLHGGCDTFLIECYDDLLVLDTAPGHFSWSRIQVGDFRPSKRGYHVGFSYANQFVVGFGQMQDPYDDGHFYAFDLTALVWNSAYLPDVDSTTIDIVALFRWAKSNCNIC